MIQKLMAIELRLADVILLDNVSAYACATVKNINKETGAITLFRPYTQTADFSYTGGVMCYIGVEVWDINPRSGELFTGVSRKELK